QPAREALRQIELLFAREREGSLSQRGIQRRAVRLRRAGDVVGTLQTSFNLEATDAELHESVDEVICREVLRAEQVRAVAQVARLRERHLRRTVNWQRGRQAMNEPGQAEILHDDGVRASKGDRLQETHRLGQLVGENQRVEGHVTADVAIVQVFEQFRELVQ